MTSLPRSTNQSVFVLPLSAINFVYVINKPLKCDHPAKQSVKIQKYTTITNYRSLKNNLAVNTFPLENTD
jgi:hypothetical protein